MDTVKAFPLNTWIRLVSTARALKSHRRLTSTRESVGANTSKAPERRTCGQSTAISKTFQRELSFPAQELAGQNWGINLYYYYYYVFSSGTEGTYPQISDPERPEIQESRKVCYINRVIYHISTDSAHEWSKAKMVLARSYIHQKWLNPQADEGEVRWLLRKVNVYNIIYLNNKTIHWKEVEAYEGLPNQINPKSGRATSSPFFNRNRCRPSKGRRCIPDVDI